MSGTRQPRVDVVLLATLAGALALRVWGIGYGLPHVYNPDEVAILSRALSLAEKGLNPGNFVYPTLYFYVLAAVVGGAYGVEWLTGAVGSIDQFQSAFWTDPTSVYLLARWLSVAAGVAGVAVTYVLARALGGRSVARTAAVLMAVAYFPVRDAHMIKHDVIATLLFALVVLQSRRVWLRGRSWDYAAAGILAGATLAFHYYGILAVVPIAAAAILRSGGIARLLADRGVYAAAGAWALTFFLLSPYVVLDFAAASRDIAQNRQILVDRARETFGWIGAGGEQFRLTIAQGAGAPMAMAAAIGAIVLARRSWREAVWLLAFPAAFALLLTQTWPYGRLQNALYPFIAVAAALGIDGVGSRLTRPRVVLILTAVCAAVPLWHGVVLDRLMTREDTRTSARRWIEAHVPDAAVVAVQPYSVPLETSREWLLATLAGQTAPEGLGARARGLLARSPYPAPAYRLVFLGSGGLDRDKRFVAPEAVLAAPGISALRAAGISYVVLKRTSAAEADPLRERLARDATMVYRAWPFTDEDSRSAAQLPDHDIRPTLEVRQPGPIIEVWRLVQAPDVR